MRQVPYHLLTSDERKNPAITKSKVDMTTFDYEKQVYVVDLKKRDSASVPKMKRKPVVVSLKVCMSLIIKKHYFHTLNLFLYSSN